MKCLKKCWLSTISLLATSAIAISLIAQEQPLDLDSLGTSNETSKSLDFDSLTSSNEKPAGTLNLNSLSSESDLAGVPVPAIETPESTAGAPSNDEFSEASAALTPTEISNGDAEPQEAKRFTVVGSRIKGIDLETTTPVLRIDRQELDKQGYSTIGSVMQNLTLNSGATITAEGSGLSFGAGLNSFNFRGLGNNNTLVLLDNRRAAPAGAGGFNGFQTVFDFNSVPASMVESIEISKDGGSAIYGSDAVAGVVNIKLRKDFEGLETRVSYANNDSTDSAEKAFSLLYGKTTDKMSLVFNADYRHRNSIKLIDVDITSSADQTRNGGNNLLNTADWPASYTINNTRFVPYGLTDVAPGPFINSFQTDDGSFDTASREDLFGEEETFGYFIDINYELTDDVSVFVQSSYRENHILFEANPVPLRNIFENGDGPEGQIILPASNPANPTNDFSSIVFVDSTRFNTDLTELFEWRLLELGNREFDNEFGYLRQVAGLQGDIRGTSWSWEVAGIFAKSTADFLTRNVSTDERMQHALSGTIPGLPGLFANPFGNNDPRVIEYLRYEDGYDGSFEMMNLELFLTGDIFDLPAGPISTAFGGELRNEDFRENHNELQETGGVLGGTEISSVGANRQVQALFGEFRIPITPQTELQVAGRLENYSDFGVEFSPKVGLKQYIGKSILFRASWGQSFLAPNLPFLYQPAVTTFTNPFLDSQRPTDPFRQVREIASGNPDLQPETTQVIYFGFQWEPSKLVKNLRLGIDFFEFDREDVLTRPTSGTILADQNFYADNIERAPSVGGVPGPIQYVTSGWVNGDRQVYRGFDLFADYFIDLGDFGRLNFSGYTTHIIYLEDTNTNSQGTFEVRNEGRYGNPEWRANGSVGWSKGAWSTTLFANYTASYGHLLSTGPVPEVSDDIRFNSNVTYTNRKRNITVALNVFNIADTEPPFDDSNPQGYNRSLTTAEPRLWRLSVTKKW